LLLINKNTTLDGLYLKGVGMGDNGFTYRNNSYYLGYTLRDFSIFR